MSSPKRFVALRVTVGMLAVAALAHLTTDALVPNPAMARLKDLKPGGIVVLGSSLFEREGHAVVTYLRDLWHKSEEEMVGTGGHSVGIIDLLRLADEALDRDAATVVVEINPATFGIRQDTGITKRDGGGRLNKHVGFVVPILPSLGTQSLHLLVRTLGIEGMGAELAGAFAPSRMRDRLGIRLDQRGLIQIVSEARRLLHLTDRTGEADDRNWKTLMCSLFLNKTIHSLDLSVFNDLVSLPSARANRLVLLVPPLDFNYVDRCGPGALASTTELLDLIRERAQASGVRWIDISHVSEQAGLTFLDYGHVDDDRFEDYARVIAAALAPALGLPPPPEAAPPEEAGHSDEEIFKQR